MNKVEITFNLKGLEKFTDDFKNYRTRVGILGGHAARTDGDGINNAELGVVQMFGSLSRKIPPRDFLLLPIRVKSREILKRLQGGAIKRAVDQGDNKKVFKLLGIVAEEYIQMAFETAGFGQWPPNKPATIAKKGSSKPLIDHGELRDAVSSDVETGKGSTP